MPNQLTSSVFRILDDDDQIIGTGFLVSPNYGVTCAHVVQSIAKKPGDELRVQFHVNTLKYVVRIDINGWSTFEDGDIAFLSFLTSLPEDLKPVALGKSEESFGNDYLALGYPDFGAIEARWPKGKIGGTLRIKGKDCIDIQGQEIKEGMSGAPVLDLKNNRVIGMISFYKDEQKPPNRFAYAVPAENLALAFPLLRLWSSMYGPDEWRAYLDFLVSVNGQLTLPDGRKVPLEKIYVSLRADEMNAAERKAEHDLYLQDVEKLKEQMSPTNSDPYEEHNFMRRVISQHPRMQMLVSRNWQTHFAARNDEKLNLAEVVRRHPCVVLLGDPGSGKTTLGRWLTLQQSRALINRRQRLLVSLDLVQPNFRSASVGRDKSDSSIDADEMALREIQIELDQLKNPVDRQTLADFDSSQVTTVETDYGQIDLGAPCLPIFIRIAEYARNRWQSSLDSGLSLLDFISLGKLNEQNVSPDINPIAIGTMCRDALLYGNALVILDGLDEVGNPDQRRAVMQVINEFIEVHVRKGNKILLTSRIVGYQFHPLTHLPHYTVEDMDDASIRAFCRAWMSHFYDLGDTEERGKRLSDTILEHDHLGVKALAGNPLMLTLLSQVYRESGERALPHRRVDLFDETLHVLYKRREYLWDSKNITELRLARALASVAYYLHSSEPAGFTDRGTIAACLRAVLQSPDQVEEVLAVADEAAGFLVSRGEGVYGFLHRALQEYFAARYLVDDPDKASSHLLEHILDPTWREILVLALGKISQIRYPVANRSDFVREVWKDVLIFPDSAGDVLPRRALLLAMATSECEQFPHETFSIVVEQLLTVYGKQLAPVLQERIQRAFNSMKSGQAEDVVETALCEFLCSPNLDHRWAAANLIIETQWDSQSIANALIKAWTNYSEPTGSLLVAMNGLHARHSEYLSDSLLSFRSAMKDEPKLWSLIQTDDFWRIVVEALYLYPGQKFDLENIWRDSPLTLDFLTRLRKGESFQDWIGELYSVSEQINTSKGRDAALILAGLGEVIPQIIKSIQSGPSSFPHGFLACLRYLVEFASDKDAAFQREIARALHVARNLNLNGARLRSQSVAKFLGLERSLARDLTIVLNRGVDALNAKRTTALAQAINFALDYDNGADKFADDIELDILLFRARSIINRTVREIITPIDLVNALKNARFPTNYARDHSLALGQARGLDTSRDFDFDHGFSVFEYIQVIKLIVHKGLRGKNINPLTREQLESCLEILGAIEATPVNGWAQSGSFVTQAISTSKILLRIKKEVTSEVKLIEMPIEEIVADLSSVQDYRRYSAVQALQTSLSAQQLGRERLEKMAQMAVKYNDQPQIGTQLSWALNRIEFDCPDWIREWAISLESAGEADSPEEEILQSIYKASSLALNSMVELIPHSSQRVNKAVLQSFRWQGYLNTIRSEDSSFLIVKIRDWLFNEKSPEIIEYILEVLGHWRPDSKAALDIILSWTPSDDAYLTWVTALARIGGVISDVDISRSVEERLTDGAKENVFAVAGLVRYLLLKDLDYVDKLNNLMSDQGKILQVLFLAGTDSDVWNDKYHSNLVVSIQTLCSKYPEQLLSVVLDKLRSSLNTKDNNGWPQRRIALAVVAACVEIMPTETQRVAGGAQTLELLLVKGSKDSGSFNSRRFAITALGYLRIVPQTVIPVLLEGLKENIEAVQNNTLEAVSRFQRFQGDMLSVLLPYLTIENAPVTAYGVAKLLGAIGTSPAAEITAIRSDIIQGLANAIRHPNSQQDVVLLKVSSLGGIETVPKGKLFDYLAQEMLRVAGWL